jgi:hypothetical protein
MDGKVEVDLDRTFREEGELVVHVTAKRTWLLNWRLRVFFWLVRFASFVTRLRVADIITGLDEEPDGEAG